MTEDADLFFGRDQEIQVLLERLAAFRFVSVIGVSGCGKSSLVRAGVVPVLKCGIVAGLGSRWLTATVRPGGSPIAALREELERHFPGVVAATWPTTSLDLADLLRSALPPSTRFLLIVDQFEELFRFRKASLARDGGNEAALFVNLLLNAVDQQACSAYVVLTMRSDHLGDCAQFSGLPEAINSSPYLVPRMTRIQRREAIERPLAREGILIAPQLVQTLLNETSEDPDDLPVLQHALMRIWDNWRKRGDPQLPLNLADYWAIGTTREAISLHADEALDEVRAKFGDAGETTVRRIFQRITDRDSDGHETRRPCSLRELVLVAETGAEIVRGVIESFRPEGRNFLTPYLGDLHDDTQIDVSHESLLRRWDRLRKEWIPEEERSRRTYLRLASRAEESVRNVQQPDGSIVPRIPYEFDDSLSGVLLQQALEWWDGRKPNATWAGRYHPGFDLAEAYLLVSKSRNAQTLASSWDDAAELIRKLTTALESFDWSGADSICRELVERIGKSNEPLPAPMARLVLSGLLRKRRFAAMESVADAMIRKGENRAELLRFYAQALIEQGDLGSALRVLESILSNQFASANDKAEARGLVGRIYKQRYVNAKAAGTGVRQEDLRLAIVNYFQVYQSQPSGYLWQGVNVVALLARAERDAVTVDGYPTYQEIAAKMEAVINEQGSEGFESGAVASELAMALGKQEEAVRYLREYVERPEIDAFALASVLRQFETVWELSLDREPGATILPILRAAVLRRSGGNVELPSAAPQLSRLEAVLGQDRYQTVNWYSAGLERAKAVARVEDREQRPRGTGFLVRAEEFFPERAGELFFMTCAHVLGPANQHEAIIHFTALDLRVEVRGLVWSSAALDVSFFALRNYPSVEAFSVSPRNVPKTVPPQRLYIIGHPSGRDLAISDGLLLDVDETHLHYRVPTEPGSAGSPICESSEWQVVGIHHAGSSHMRRLHGETGTYEANEGIGVAAIKGQIAGDIREVRPRKVSVFISYDRADSAAWALLCKNELERRFGCTVFMDTERLESGRQWPKRLTEAIGSADAFVCFLGSRTLESRWVSREIEEARLAAKPMIPVFLESFRHPADQSTLSPHVQELLATKGVILLDRSNIFIDAAITKVGESVRDAAAVKERTG